MTGQPWGSSELGAGRNHPPPKADVCHTWLESFHTCAFLQTQGTREGQPILSSWLNFHCQTVSWLVRRHMTSDKVTNTPACACSASSRRACTCSASSRRACTCSASSRQLRSPSVETCRSKQQVDFRITRGTLEGLNQPSCFRWFLFWTSFQSPLCVALLQTCDWEEILFLDHSRSWS